MSYTFTRGSEKNFRGYLPSAPPLIASLLKVILNQNLSLMLISVVSSRKKLKEKFCQVREEQENRALTNANKADCSLQESIQPSMYLTSCFLAWNPIYSCIIRISDVQICISPAAYFLLNPCGQCFLTVKSWKRFCLEFLSQIRQKSLRLCSSSIDDSILKYVQVHMP